MMEKVPRGSESRKPGDWQRAWNVDPDAALKSSGRGAKGNRANHQGKLSQCATG